MEPCCPVCGAAQAGAGAGSCPLFPAWASEAKVLYMFEDAKRGQPIPPEVRRFWSAALEHYLRRQKRALLFTPEELAGAFTRRAVLRPLCLDRVATEADTRGETALLVSLSPACYAAVGHEQQQLGAGGPRFAAVRWAVRTLVLAPLGAAWSLVAGHDELNDDSSGGHVEEQERLKELREPRAHVGLLKEVAAALAGHFAHRLDVERTVLVTRRGQAQAGVVTVGDGGGVGSSSSGPCTLQEACQAAAGAAGAGGVQGILEGMTEQECLLLADFLVAQGQAARDGEYLKFVGGGKSKGKGPVAVTEADKKLLDFRLQVRQLEAALARREADMLEAKARAVAHHKEGLTHRAAVELARYKKLGELVGKLRGAVLNLLTLHYSIEGVAADVTVFEGLKGGSAALKEQRAAAERAGLGSVRDVDEAMVEARELVEETQELSAAFAQPMLRGAGVGEGEEEEEAALLKELEALEAEQQGLEGVSDVAAALPDVSHLPPPRVAVASPAEKKEEGAKKAAAPVALPL